MRAESAADDTLPDAPLALVACAGSAMRLIAVDARAQALGLAAGQALADARAVVPELEAIAHDAAADARWLERLGRHCRAWTPLVALAPPDALLLDIAGCTHLAGGEAALLAAVQEGMAVHGMSSRAALGATAAAARALARFGGESVKALPVAALGLDEEATTALRGAGLASIGDLADRPLASVAARFGEKAVRALRELLGEVAVPLDPLRGQAPLRFEHRFNQPVAHEPTIAAVLLELMREAAAELAARDLGGCRFRLTLCRSDNTRRWLAVDTGAPTRDPALVLRLFEERIGSLVDPLDPGSGYDSIALAVPATEPLADAQPELASEAGAETALAELVDRLGTRLGEHAACRLLPRGSHVPEQGQLALPAIHAPARAPARCSSPAASEPPLRPLLLFDPPQPVEVLAEVPDGPPHRFRWKRKLHEIRLYQGPERIADAWSKRPEGEEAGKGDLPRDYYRVEDMRGRRFWLFRHGPSTEKPRSKWFMHGLLA